MNENFRSFMLFFGGREVVENEEEVILINKLFGTD